MIQNQIPMNYDKNLMLIWILRSKLFGINLFLIKFNLFLIKFDLFVIKFNLFSIKRSKVDIKIKKSNLIGKKVDKLTLSIKFDHFGYIFNLF